MSKNPGKNADEQTTVERSIDEQKVLIKEEIQRFITMAKDKESLSIEEINELLPPEIIAAEVLDQFMQALEVAGVEFTESSENSKDEDGSDAFFLGDPSQAEDEEDEEKEEREETEADFPISS
ncbi:MAG: RNA polymerase sigma factor region1.1 domain-containing protein, partial [Bdellovibrionales bacterium]|nr:RNA polymerase sigma factor region1.1 domain-containing protein [Bdellovibrionales bacterium]